MHCVAHKNDIIFIIIIIIIIIDIVVVFLLFILTPFYYFLTFLFLNIIKEELWLIFRDWREGNGGNKPAPLPEIRTLLTGLPVGWSYIIWHACACEDWNDWNFLKGKMASQSKGIQQLLQAEKKAADLVSEARKRKLSFIRLFLFNYGFSWENFGYKIKITEETIFVVLRNVLIKLCRVFKKKHF